jgi:uncharacterized protein (TIGR02145 family)
MKKIFLVLILGSALVSCKKETTNSNNSSNNTTNSSTCVDNPNINFKSIGTAIGKSADCLKDIEGNTYKVVTIGSQTWMAENLKTTKYNDGSIIQNLKDDKEWSNASSSLTAAWCYYKNDSTNNVKFGKLYNWYAVNRTTNGNKNICPTGWHVPTDAEWTVLTDYLGGEGISGGKMKEAGSISWNSPNIDATNSSLFTGIPGGYINNNGVSDSIGYRGYWWSSTEYNTPYAWYRSLSYKVKVTYRNYFVSKKSGISVRCIKD